MIKQLLLAIISISILACNSAKKENPAASPQTDSIKTGGNKLITIDGKNKVWTKKVGEGKIKVLLLHGGPGFSHDYMECFEDFLPKEGMEIYYYDQLGSGNSDAPADTSL